MLGILLLILSFAALKVAAWQAGVLTGFFETTQTPDYTIAGLSLTAAIIFFGLWLAGRIHKNEAKADFFSD